MLELYVDETPLGDAVGDAMEMHVPTPGHLEIGNLEKDGKYFLQVRGCEEKRRFTAACPVCEVGGSSSGSLPRFSTSGREAVRLFYCITFYVHPGYCASVMGKFIATVHCTIRPSLGSRFLRQTSSAIVEWQ